MSGSRKKDKLQILKNTNTMKKLTLILILLIGSISLSANSKGETFLYCEILGIIGSTVGYQVQFADEKQLVDDSGEVMLFKTKIDAISYLGKKGWEFSLAYKEAAGRSFTYDKWLLKLNITGLTEEEVKVKTGKIK